MNLQVNPVSDITQFPNSDPPGQKLLDMQTLHDLLESTKMPNEFLAEVTALPTTERHIAVLDFIREKRGLAVTARVGPRLSTVVCATSKAIISVALRFNRNSSIFQVRNVFDNINSSCTTGLRPSKKEHVTFLKNFVQADSWEQKIGGCAGASKKKGLLRLLCQVVPGGRDVLLFLSLLFVGGTSTVTDAALCVPHGNSCVLETMMTSVFRRFGNINGEPEDQNIIDMSSCLRSDIQQVHLEIWAAVQRWLNATLKTVIARARRNTPQYRNRKTLEGTWRITDRYIVRDFLGNVSETNSSVHMFMVELYQVILTNLNKFCSAWSNEELQTVTYGSVHYILQETRAVIRAKFLSTSLGPNNLCDEERVSVERHQLGNQEIRVRGPRHDEDQVLVEEEQNNAANYEEIVDMFKACVLSPAPSEANIPGISCGGADEVSIEILAQITQESEHMNVRHNHSEPLRSYSTVPSNGRPLGLSRNHETDIPECHVEDLVRLSNMHSATLLECIARRLEGYGIPSHTSADDDGYELSISFQDSMNIVSIQSHMRDYYLFWARFNYLNLYSAVENFIFGTGTEQFKTHHSSTHCSLQTLRRSHPQIIRMILMEDTDVDFGVHNVLHFQELRHESDDNQLRTVGLAVVVEIKPSTCTINASLTVLHCVTIQSTNRDRYGMTNDTEPLLVKVKKVGSVHNHVAKCRNGGMETFSHIWLPLRTTLVTAFQTTNSFMSYRTMFSMLPQGTKSYIRHGMTSINMSPEQEDGIIGISMGIHQVATDHLAAPNHFYVVEGCSTTGKTTVISESVYACMHSEMNLGNNYKTSGLNQLFRWNRMKDEDTQLDTITSVNPLREERVCFRILIVCPELQSLEAIFDQLLKRRWISPNYHEVIRMNVYVPLSVSSVRGQHSSISHSHVVVCTTQDIPSLAEIESKLHGIPPYSAIFFDNSEKISVPDILSVLELYGRDRIVVALLGNISSINSGSAKKITGLTQSVCEQYNTPMIKEFMARTSLSGRLIKLLQPFRSCIRGDTEMTIRLPC